MTTTFTPLSSAESPTRTLFGTGDISMGDISTPHQLHQIHNWSMTINPMYDENNPPAGLNSRTRKRLRDGRPDESLIHETTYNILYAAARSPPPTPSSPIAFPPTPTRVSHPHRRSAPQPSLHQFWNLPTTHKPTSTNNSRRTSTTGVSLVNTVALFQSQSLAGSLQTMDTKAYANTISRCEDCDGDLSSAKRFGTVDSNMMDLDIPVEGEIDLQNYSCLSCSRVVCDLCAVVCVGESRECLQCKTSPNRPTGGMSGIDKRWVGGIGWCGVDCY
ncbi:MAG: hypothetical protein MMC33_006250 [Icmadophila ericetorum]|nr:hypothetical protein [Icmadophila ericetorum]